MEGGYNYIIGYTDIFSGETVIDDEIHRMCTRNMLEELLIKNILHKIGCKEKFINGDEVDYILGDCRIKWEDSESVKIFKTIKVPGYIYNSTKDVLIYSVFFRKVYPEGSGRVIECDSEIEEIEQVKVDLEVVKEKPLDFMEELKMKIQNLKIQDNIEDKIEKNESELLAGIRTEIDLRKQRSKIRERKLERKRRKKNSVCKK
jgi:hypothetical protein